MPLVSTGTMLRQARSEGYAVAAYNMIDYNSARSIVDGAKELDAPIIVQTSVKTVRLWGFKAIAAWVQSLADDVEVPVALHLDHCTDLEVIKGCVEAGWSSVMFDGSALRFELNAERSLRAYEIAAAAGVGLEAEMGAIGGVEDDKFLAEDAAILADYDECVAFCRQLPGLAAFAPAIGTAHGLYKGTPKIAYDLLNRIAGDIDIPIALHGGTGLEVEQFHACIKAGCAKVNISTMHKHRFVDGFVSLAGRNPSLREPIPFIDSQYEAMKADVKDMIKIFGSAGKAGHNLVPCD